MRHILIIENDKFLSKSLKKYLQGQKYEVSSSEDGEDGLKKIETMNPDLVLLDIGIPKINGFQVLEKLRGNPALSLIPVIIISNSGEPVEVKRTKDLGVKGFIIKAHLTLTEVGEKIENILSGRTFDDFSLSQNKVDIEVSDSSPGETKIKILLIEDDDFFAQICERGLKQRNFSAIRAIDGEEGLLKLREEKPDLILLDIIMPKMSGLEVLRRIREEKEPVLANTPVIMLTNLYQKADIESSKILRADAYLIKATANIEEVVAKINEVLRK